MRAAVLDTLALPRPYAVSRPLIIRDVTLDPPGAGELLISIRAAGLCHSDLSVIDGNRARPLPMVLGHEAAGVVEELGAGVTDLRVGDHVVTTFVPSCGVCEPCARERAALCEPGAASNAAGSLIGGIGLAALLGAKVRSAGVLIAVDLSARKLELARALGATLCIDAAAPGCVEQIREATRGGVDYAFEMAGSQQAMELAYRITRRGGTTVTAGLPHPSVAFSVPHVSIVGEERTIKGSYLGSCNPQRDIPRYIEWFQAGKLPVERLLSEEVALDNINAAFDALADAATVRQVVVP